MSTNNVATGQRSSLPTFTPLHALPSDQYSNAGSDKASSSRSATQSHSRSIHEEEARDSPVTDTRRDSQRLSSGIGQGFSSSKRQKRSSGGFLLNSSPTSSRLARSILSRKSLKGKEKSEDDPLIVPKTRNQVDGQGSSPSVRASLLSNDPRPSSSDQYRGDDSLRSSHNFDNTLGSPAQNGSLHSHRSSERGQHLPSFGYDTDPAQIVDMALRLTEGRKRQASAKRFVSSGTRSRRGISDATSLPPSVTSASKPYANGSVNAVSKSKASGPDPLTPERPNRDGTARTQEASPLVQDGFSPEQDAEEVDQEMQVSRATQNRVAKAKAYFELAYEHRRLLSHLPPIRSPSEPYPSDQAGYDSKCYNPLQYARNRKLRFRERHPINSEVEGWHDIDKVRAWVDAVVKSTPTTQHDPVQCIRLPPLTLLEEDAKEPSDSDENADPQGKRRNNKVRRPKSDWVTHPGDLIADAFWTEQGLNKKKIYNRDNEPIYPPGTKFMFAGWRNRTPLEVPEELRMYASSPEESPIQNKKLIDSPPELPAFESAHKEHTWARARLKFGKTLKKDKKAKRGKKGQDIFDTSDESSDSGASRESSKDRRGRKRATKEKFNLSEGDPFARPVQTVDHESAARGSSEFDPESPYQGRDSMDRAHLLRYLRRTSTSIAEDNEESKRSKRRKFLDSIKLDADNAGRSSFEYDSTAPGTPIANGFPSIAINLSPPDSRSPSPERKNSNFLGVVKDKALSTMNSRDYRDTKNHIDGTDFAQPISHSTSRTRNSYSHHRDISRTASPMTRGISPGDYRRKSSSVDGSVNLLSAEPRSATVSKVNSRATDHSQRSHRVRGMFKGGRIAELVGHEVNRVGDFIWKRDPPRHNVMDRGSVSGYETESDDFSDYMMDKPTKGPVKQASKSSLSQASARSISPSARETKLPSTSSTTALAPQYHVPGLPSFTSPFQKDRDAHDKKAGGLSPGGTPLREEKGEHDPVSSGAAASRARRSPRFDQLAPPRLDVRSATPDGRRSSYGFGAGLDMTRTLSASQTYNSAISGSAYRPRESTRVSSIAVPTPYFNIQDDASQAELSLSRTRSSVVPKQVTIHDYSRLRGLLFSVGIKAMNITSYCEEVPNPQSSFLYSAFETTKARDPEIQKNLPAPRKREHVIAARHLINHVNTQSNQFNDNLHRFSITTAVDLQREIQILEDNTESSLFPRLQKLSDEAGELAQKLTTTSRLAIRNVDDEVSKAARMKRRGPFRISGVLWYKLMEWGVVGLLWGIWAVATTIRVGLGIVRAVWAIIAWLLWFR